VSGKDNVLVSKISGAYNTGAIRALVVCAEFPADFGRHNNQTGKSFVKTMKRVYFTKHVIHIMQLPTFSGEFPTSN
jgi:hypothetical protein